MRYLMTVFFLIMCFSISIGQNVITDHDKKTQFSVFISRGYRYVDISNDNSNESSNIGIGAQISISLSHKIGLIFKSGWLKWPENRETVIPLLVGPSYHLVDSGSIRIIAYGTIGPMLTFGNDYAGVFAKHEIGFQFTSTATKNLVVGMSWGQDVVFHPSEYSVIKGSVGWSF